MDDHQPRQELDRAVREVGPVAARLVPAGVYPLFNARQDTGTYSPLPLRRSQIEAECGVMAERASDPAQGRVCP